MSDEISVLYDSIDGVMLKHGRPNQISAHLKKYKVMEENDPTLFKFKVVTSSKWDVKELNKILTHSGYVSFLESDVRRFEEAICLE